MKRKQKRQYNYVMGLKKSREYWLKNTLQQTQEQINNDRVMKRLNIYIVVYLILKKEDKYGN